MKFISLAITTAAITGAAAQVPLAQKWNITDPTFSYDSLSFALDFQVSDFIANGMSDYSLWTTGCQEDGDEIPKGAAGPWTDTRLDDIDGALASLTGANRDRNIGLNITLDTEEVVTSGFAGFYSESTDANGQIIAEVNFCVRFGLYTPSTLSDGQGGTIAPIEVNFLETLITLFIDLTDGFQIGDIAVEPRDRLEVTANQAYQVIGYECTTTLDADGYFTARADTATPRNQGDVIRVCVEPEDEAKNDGIFMRSIENFSFSRTTPNQVDQECIIGGVASPNLLTSFDENACAASKQCVFETILFAAFFTELGTVDGEGVANLQFGSTTAQNRKLRAGAKQQRSLQEEDLAGAAAFDLQVEVNRGAGLANSGACSLGVASMVAAVMGAAVFM